MSGKFEIETDMERAGNAVAGAVIGGLFFVLAAALVAGFALPDSKRRRARSI